jgi:hypothetical protein
MSTLLLNQLVRPIFSEDEAVESKSADLPYTWQEQLEAIRARLVITRMNAESTTTSSQSIR